MQTLIIKNKRSFFSILGLLLVIAIVLLLYYIVFNVYFKNHFVDKNTKETVSGQGREPSYKAVLESTREQVKDIEKQLLERSR